VIQRAEGRHRWLRRVCFRFLVQRNRRRSERHFSSSRPSFGRCRWEHRQPGSGCLAPAPLWGCDSLVGMTVPAKPNPPTGIRALGAAMVVTLLCQLLLGMANTFWLTVPDSGSAWSVETPTGLLMAHMTLGVVLLVLAIWIAVAAFRGHDRNWLTASAFGIFGILLGFGGGIAFMGQTSNDGASFLMAVGTSVAIAGYALGLHRLPVARTT
jgi:hypothetical protein